MIVPRNGILLRPFIEQIVVVSGMMTGRNMWKIIRGGFGKTCVLPNTIFLVGECAFKKSDIVSVRFKEYLRILGKRCFDSSGIRKLVLSSNVGYIDSYAFYKCKRLEYVDLSAARNLTSIGNYAFY